MADPQRDPSVPYKGGPDQRFWYAIGEFTSLLHFLVLGTCMILSGMIPSNDICAATSIHTWEYWSIYGDKGLTILALGWFYTLLWRTLWRWWYGPAFVFAVLLGALHTFCAIWYVIAKIFLRSNKPHVLHLGISNSIAPACRTCSAGVDVIRQPIPDPVVTGSRGGYSRVCSEPVALWRLSWCSALGASRALWRFSSGRTVRTLDPSTITSVSTTTTSLRSVCLMVLRLHQVSPTLQASRFLVTKSRQAHPSFMMTALATTSWNDRSTLCVPYQGVRQWRVACCQVSRCNEIERKDTVFIH